MKILKALFFNIINFFHSYKVIFLGFVIFSIYIWARFIRARIPKDIPFNLSLFGFLILIEICLIYFYIVIKLLREPKEQSFIIKTLLEILYKPLEDFDYFWKHLFFIKDYYKIFATWFAYKLKPFIINSSIFYFIFAIFPRIILINALFIDINIFYELFYVYKFLYVGILLFLHRYIIYSLKMLKKDLIEDLKEDVRTISTDYEFGIHPSHWPENFDPDEEDAYDISPTMVLPIDIFIEFYTNKLIYENEEIWYSITDYRDEFYHKIRDKYNVPKAERIPYNIRTQYREKTDKQIETILYLIKLLEYYNITSKENERFKLLKILIYTNYFLLWLNILIVSVKYNNIIALLYLMLEIINSVEEPFSGLSGLFF